MSEIHSAVGAYVVHALEGPELDEFETHLAGCPACQREVVEFRETVAELSLMSRIVAAPRAQGVGHGRHRRRTGHAARGRRRSRGAGTGRRRSSPQGHHRGGCRTGRRAGGTSSAAHDQGPVPCRGRGHGGRPHPGRMGGDAEPAAASGGRQRQRRDGAAEGAGPEGVHDRPQGRWDGDLPRVEEPEQGDVLQRRPAGADRRPDLRAVDPGRSPVDARRGSRPTRSWVAGAR